MSKVIKNNDGVAVVEGTPAASLVKDVDKFFASKPPERMAGQSISQPRKIDPRAINTRSPIRSKPQSERTDEERRANLEAFDRLSEERKREMTINTRRPLPKEESKPPAGSTPLPLPNMDERVVSRRPEEVAKRLDPRDEESADRPRTPRRNEARDKAESRRRRFFERGRSRKEAERSQNEQEATQGKFITTLRR